MKINLLSKILFSVLLAFTVNSFVYFSFGNIYSSKILNLKIFSEQFESGIYQYRILSNYFLFWIYDFLSTLNIDYQIFKFKFQDSNAEPQMYFALYILNTFFLILSAVILVLISETEKFIATESEKILIVAAAIFVMALSQFVIVPYDFSSYFFLLLFFLFFLKYLSTNTFSHLIVPVILIVISTFNRESSALSLALAATLLYGKFGLKKKTVQPLLILSAAFLCVYCGMRFFGNSFSTNDGNLLLQNLSQPKNILGLLFWMVFFTLTLLIAKDRKARITIVLFHFFSLPYIAMCFYTGILYEIRLYVPLFLTTLLLSKTETSQIH